GTARQILCVLRSAPRFHERNTVAGDEGAKQYAGPDAAALGADVAGVPATVDEVDVGVAALEEQRPVARGLAPEGVGSGVAYEIGFGLDDAPARAAFPGFPHEVVSDQEACERDGVDRQLRAAQAP